MTRGRRRIASAVLVVGLVLTGVACSGGATFDGAASKGRAVLLADGGAVGAGGIPGANTDELVPDTFCRSNTNIDACFLLKDETKAFTGPFTLGRTVPLTVNRFCSGDGYFSELGGYAGSGCWGGIMYWSSRQGSSAAGRLTPNPFTDLGAMVFKANGPWSGVTVELEITGAEEPFRNAGSPAKAHFDTPFIGSNTGSGTDGTYLASSLDGNSYGAKTSHSRPTYVITNRPVRIRLQNSAPNVTLKADVDSSSTSRFLIDPVARSANAGSVGPKSNAFFGGYRAINEESTYTLSFTVADANGATVSSPSCTGCGTKVTVVFDFDPRAANPSTASTCTVRNISPYATYSCSGASVTGDSELLTFSVNFREGS